MSKFVINLPRVAVQRWTAPLDPQGHAWVSIGEPGPNFSHVENEVLDLLPKLKLCFHDVIRLMEHGTRVYRPPSEANAKQIVDFLVSHKEKNIIVNCAAGISRSGAVAQFCQAFLGHVWDEKQQSLSIPNSKLFELMAKYFATLRRK
jgi:predicted protein tyrosine phosphatase